MPTLTQADFDTIEDRRRHKQTVVLKTEKGEVLATGHRPISEQELWDRRPREFDTLYNTKILVSHFGFSQEEIDDYLREVS